MAIKNPALYAVAPRGKAALTALPKKKRSAPAVPAARHAEHRAKHAIDQVDALLTRLEARSAAYAKEIARLTKRKGFTLARIERLQDEVLRRMEGAALKTADGWRRSLECRPCPVSVEIVNEKLIPVAYLRERVISAPDKNAIRAAIEAQTDVPGARLFQRLTLLRK